MRQRQRAWRHIAPRIDSHVLCELAHWVCFRARWLDVPRLERVTSHDRHQIARRHRDQAISGSSPAEINSWRRLPNRIEWPKKWLHLGCQQRSIGLLATCRLRPLLGPASDDNHTSYTVATKEAAPRQHTGGGRHVLIVFFSTKSAHPAFACHSPQRISSALAHHPTARRHAVPLL